ncbi:MAG: T9SS type A sorting domain-containing protein [Bacteroidota bacterium]
MKSLLLFSLIGFLSIIPQFTEAQNYTVTDGIDPSVNGMYATAGAFNGAPYLTHTTNNFSIYKNDATNEWVICSNLPPFANCIQLMDIKGGSTADNSPPLGRWDIGSFIALSPILSVELEAFQAQLTNSRHIKLEWSTATETNNDRFEIERSSNGNTFEKISHVRGRGTTVERQFYRFIDPNPVVGVNYYRLRQVDFDNSYQLSPIVSISVSTIGENISAIYPNPSTLEEVYLDIMSESTSHYQLSIHQFNGQQVFQQDNLIQKGYNKIILDIAGLPAGMYTFSIKQDHQITYRKLIKK